LLARIPPDFEWTPLEDSPVARVYRGPRAGAPLCRGLARQLRHPAARARGAERARRSRGGRRAWPWPGAGERRRAGQPLLSGMDAALRNGGADAGVHHSRAGAGGAALSDARCSFSTWEELTRRQLSFHNPRTGEGADRAPAHACSGGAGVVCPPVSGFWRVHGCVRLASRIRRFHERC
jgi:hypothetical protein